MPTGFSIGPLFIHFYGIILMTGALAGAFLADREARRRAKIQTWSGMGSSGH